MKFTKKPVTGMRDILPDEARVRTELLKSIRSVYAKYGFSEIETPLVEHIENLTGRDGGENEKLIFRIMKRGESLSRAFSEICAGEDLKSSSRPEPGDVDLLCEEGLRYDLTVPLARFFAANETKLPQPMKALQAGAVFRADRPQKGRFRQFTQCDIDILGDATNLAEKELIIAAAEALWSIGFFDYGCYVALNDRRLLFELIGYAGLPGEDAENILITLDKTDKIGPEGVMSELLDEGFEREAAEKLLHLLGMDEEGGKPDIEKLRETLGSDTASNALRNIEDIIETVTAISPLVTGGQGLKVVFDPTLVRGMGYYTGTIFELKTDAFSSSVGGGGRYDEMIGKYIGRKVPAVGFSIGFERIMTILMENGAFRDAMEGEREAWLIEKGLDKEGLTKIMRKASAERAGGREILTVWAAKNKKHQKEILKDSGYHSFREFYLDSFERKEENF